MIKNLLIDVDSTIISCEMMEILFEIALDGNEQKDEILKKVQDITNKWMSWEIWFSDSLNQRLGLLTLNKDVLNKSIDIVRQRIAPSFKSNIDNLKKYNYHIISWWFFDMIAPVLWELWIPENRIHANKFIFDQDKFLWVDTSLFAAQDMWKVKTAQQLWLTCCSWIIWDWYTDYQIKESWFAQYFIYYAGNVVREKVVWLADFVIQDFNELFVSLQEISQKCPTCQNRC